MSDTVAPGTTPPVESLIVPETTSADLRAGDGREQRDADERHA